MSLKEKFQNQTNTKKNIYYWAAVFGLIDLYLIAQQSFNYFSTGQCRNYMVFGSAAHACSLFEFIKNGWAWLSFTNVLIFLPAAATMIFASQIVDIVFAKKKD